MANQRQTAKICNVSDLLKGKYVIKEGWEPNHVETSLGNISRVNVVGVVVGAQDPLSFQFDDGTSRILVRAFEGSFDFNCKTGDLVMVIGRPRMYNNEMFIVPELVKQISVQWAEFGKEKLKQLKRTKEQIQEIPIRKTESTPAKLQDPTGQIMETISSLDNGNGAQIDSVLSKLSMQNAEDKINRLLEEGVLYSNKPGHVKIL